MFSVLSEMRLNELQVPRIRKVDDRFGDGVTGKYHKKIKGAFHSGHSDKNTVEVLDSIRERLKQ